MIYTGDLLKIGTFTVPNLVNYKVGRNKLWKDAERNMNGDVRATLIGIFPKLELNIGVCTQDQIEDLANLLDQDYFEVTYFDASIHATRTANYYASDYYADIQSKGRGLYNPFTVNLVPVSKI